MKSSIRYFLPIVLAVLLLSACHKNSRLIPRDDLAEVYADMFLADQWIFDHELKYMTDTVAVYEPILDKHGYTVDDFRHSIDIYLNDADGFMDIMADVKYILQCRLKDIDKRRELKSKLDSINMARAKNEIEISLLGKEGMLRDTLIKKLFKIFPVDSIVNGGAHELYKGPFVVNKAPEKLKELVEK